MDITTGWLGEYVDLSGITAEELAKRLMLAGLNFDGMASVPADGRAKGPNHLIKVEITSNRPDCLGMIGVAREVAVLWQRALKPPAAKPAEGKALVAQATSVKIECPELCPRYTARVIRGVRVGPSPAWMVERLRALGIASINNVVDITNYVLMECGQPLHAFDFAKLAGGQIVVREPRAGEKLEAIDHRTYELTPGMCVIADRDRAVGVAGIMGGASTEVTTTTRDVLIEAAEFDPSTIRAAARKLSLHSDSSYRFERGVDPAGVDWASRRACELILELAGGELCQGIVDAGRTVPVREAIVLRLAQIPRILGIDVPADRVKSILTSLGCTVSRDAKSGQLAAVPPTWRADLSREIDLIEEVARIHGYEAIPEDVSVPMARSARTPEDRALERVGEALVAHGFDEALTVSVVEEDWSEAFSPWTEAAPLSIQTPLLRRATQLRRSLIPSLLGARRTNESLANPVIELFEIAKVYLPRGNELPDEALMLGLVSGRELRAMKGAVEAIVARLNPTLDLAVEPYAHPLLAAGEGARLTLAGQLVGFIGQLSQAGMKRFELRHPATVAEVSLRPLMDRTLFVPQYVKLSTQPAITRDLNLVVDESIHWSDIEQTIRQHAGPLLEQIEYRDTYRDAQRLGAGKKSLLLSIQLRHADATLTSAEADALRDQLVAACHTAFGAQLRA
ncbi:MAG: phenylalanine--tRNA ligase subunit beta [Planctomycetes bacterium]|nr:phenylalanine--tRNA ligase subunit beta [Planctomycetota bacterium]